MLRAVTLALWPHVAQTREICQLRGSPNRRRNELLSTAPGTRYVHRCEFRAQRASFLASRQNKRAVSSHSVYRQDSRSRRDCSHPSPARIPRARSARAPPRRRALSTYESRRIATILRAEGGRLHGCVGRHTSARLNFSTERWLLTVSHPSLDDAELEVCYVG